MTRKGLGRHQQGRVTGSFCEVILLSFFSVVILISFCLKNKGGTDSSSEKKVKGACMEVEVR
jgi:hypothetical protein